jgi:6-phosphogluconolactonase (cycloisomerase 2 family)
MAAFRVDGDTGELERFATYDVGSSPLWIEFIQQG